MNKKLKTNGNFLLFRGTTDENDYLFDKKTMTFKLDNEILHPIWFTDKKEIAIEYHEAPGKVYTAEIGKLKLFDTNLDNDTLLGSIKKNEDGKLIFYVNQDVKKNILNPLKVDSKILIGCIKYLASESGLSPIEEAKEASIFDLMMFPEFFKLLVKNRYNCLRVKNQGLSSNVLSNAYGILDPKLAKVITIED